MTAPRKGSRPTITSRIERVLRDADDFVRAPAIVAAIADPDVRIDAVLNCLQVLHRRKAANFVHEGRATFWYLTPETDERVRRLEEKVLHGPGSRGGKRKRPPIAPEGDGK